MRRLPALLAAPLLLVLCGMALSSAATASVVVNINKATQRMTVTVDGEARFSWPVSTGTKGYATPAGTFSVFRKERMSWSVPFSQWLPWASYFFQGIAFHEYASVPTYPASHGCVRVPGPEARYLYRFADIGLKVVVF